MGKSGWLDCWIRFLKELQYFLQFEENEMDYFVGLDISLRSVADCVIYAVGMIILERSVAWEIVDNSTTT